VVAVLALGVAIGGTAIGAGSKVPGKNGVKASDIAPGAVKKKKLAAGAVGGAKLGEIVVHTLDASMGDDGAQGDGAVLANAVTVPCGSGEKVISGGGSYTVTDATAAVSIRSSFREDNGWRTAYINDSGEAQTATAYAYCLK
jgi:hypothetical protein